MREERASVGRFWRVALFLFLFGRRPIFSFVSDWTMYRNHTATERGCTSLVPVAIRSSWYELHSGGPLERASIHDGTRARATPAASGSTGAGRGEAGRRGSWRRLSATAGAPRIA